LETGVVIGVVGVILLLLVFHGSWTRALPVFGVVAVVVFWWCYFNENKNDRRLLLRTRTVTIHYKFDIACHALVRFRSTAQLECCQTGFATVVLGTTVPNPKKD
jgi:hypothetical protein